MSMNHKQLKLLDVVAILEDMPKYGLRRGEVGTIVESLAPDVWLVEFSNNNGEEYAMASIKTEALIRLYYKPANQPKKRTPPTFVQA